MTETPGALPASGTDGLSAGRRVRLGLITAALAVFFLAVFAIYTWVQLHPEFAGEPLVVKVWFFVAAELTLACGVYCALQSLEIWVGPGTRVTTWARSAGRKVLVVGAVAMVFGVLWLVFLYGLIAGQT